MSFPTPPVYQSPVVIDKSTGKSSFNPVWLQWFLDFSGGSANNLAQVTYSASPVTISGGSTNVQVILSAAPTGLIYVRGSQKINLPLVQTVMVSPGDGIQVSFSGSITATFIPM